MNLQLSSPPARGQCSCTRSAVLKPLRGASRATLATIVAQGGGASQTARSQAEPGSERGRVRRRWCSIMNDGRQNPRRDFAMSQVLEPTFPAPFLLGSRRWRIAISRWPTFHERYSRCPIGFAELIEGASTWPRRLSRVIGEHHRSVIPWVAHQLLGGDGGNAMQRQPRIVFGRT